MVQFCILTAICIQTVLAAKIHQKTPVKPHKPRKAAMKNPRMNNHVSRDSPAVRYVWEILQVCRPEWRRALVALPRRKNIDKNSLHPRNERMFQKMHRLRMV